jgi:VIT1/CCC1 family predicted Fe2+/Mn2+ transporter
MANLLADGLSMAVSNYQGAMSEVERQAKMRKREHLHCRLIPEAQRGEIRQIYKGKGFSGALLEHIVEVIMKNPEVCVNTVLNEEIGMLAHQPKPLYSALATFGAFVVLGSIPLMPFIILGSRVGEAFVLSIVATGVVFGGIGIVKARLVERPVVRSTLETMVLGGGAAVVAYLIGALVRSLYGGTQPL